MISCFNESMHSLVGNNTWLISQTHLQSLPATERERTAVLLQFQSLHREPKIRTEEIFYRTKTRYQTDFKELHTIGKGGFGKVFKVSFIHSKRKQLFF